MPHYPIAPFSHRDDDEPPIASEQALQRHLLATWQQVPGIGQYYAAPAATGWTVLGAPLIRTGHDVLDMANASLVLRERGLYQQWRTQAANAGQWHLIQATDQRQRDAVAVRRFNLPFHLKSPIGIYHRAVGNSIKIARAAPGLDIITGGAQPRTLPQINNALANLPERIRKLTLKRDMLLDSIAVAERDLLKLGMTADQISALGTYPTGGDIYPIAPHEPEGLGALPSYIEWYYPPPDLPARPGMSALINAVLRNFPVLDTYVPDSGTPTQRANAYSNAVSKEISKLRTLMDDVAGLEKELMAKRTKVEALKREPIVATEPEPEPAPAPEEPVSEPLPPTPPTIPSEEILKEEPTTPAPSEAVSPLPAPPPPIEAPPPPPPAALQETEERAKTIRRVATGVGLVLALRRVLG